MHIVVDDDDNDEDNDEDQNEDVILVHVTDK
jgi:hypothetical protein